MLNALADALVGSFGERPYVRALYGDDGAEAILHLACRAGDGTVAGSCTPTYLTTPRKKGLAVTVQEFTPLAGLVADTYIVVVSAHAPWRDAESLFATRSVVAAAPPGGNTHIQALLIGDVIPGSIEIIGYSSLREATDAVISENADWTTGVFGDFAEAISGGALRVIGTFAAEADPGSLAPTLREQGIPVTFRLWRGLVGPPSMEDAAIKRWVGALGAAVSTSVWMDYIVSDRVRASYLSASEFRSLLIEEDVAYREWQRRLSTD
jgi:putative tricarboxylic transport membrane protein